jgi:hypothetical protein
VVALWLGRWLPPPIARDVAGIVVHQMGVWLPPLGLAMAAWFRARVGKPALPQRKV